jgi:3-methyladenine DNA glycosylase/8-oxoguanine DNA glycosylase
MPETVLRPGRSLDLALTLGALRRGLRDPTCRIAPGEVWRATRTPLGPASLRLRSRGAELVAEAWGEGADWALDRLPELVGERDDTSDFRPRGLVAELARRLDGLRFTRSLAVFESLVPSVLEQKVPGAQARFAYTGLVRLLAEPAPGPLGLLLPPSPERLAALPYWELHRLDVERKRADTIRRAALRVRRLEEACLMEPEDALARLQGVHGVGPWTAAEVAARALGDADAVSLGDYHLPHLAAWALAGEPRGTDERMLELLEPYRGHRGRVLRLLEVSGAGAPRRGPRLPFRRIARG